MEEGDKKLLLTACGNAASNAARTRRTEDGAVLLQGFSLEGLFSAATLLHLESLAMLRHLQWFPISAVALLVAGCGGDNTGSNVDSPGDPEGVRTTVLETGAALLQNRPPIEAINAYLDGFHFYNGNIQG